MIGTLGANLILTLIGMAVVAVVALMEWYYSLVEDHLGLALFWGVIGATIATCEILVIAASMGWV